MKEFFELYSEGQYHRAIESLKKIEENKLMQIDLDFLYWKALAFARTQNFQEANHLFSQILSTGKQKFSKDFFYEYGQGLYAKNELAQAREMFKRSISNGFKTAYSKYYVAHISQILEEFKTAKDYYLLVLKDKQSDNKLKQVANFQLGEVLLSLIKNHAKNNPRLNEIVDKIVISLLSKALKIDPESPIAPDIKKRLQEILVEFDLDPNLLVNNRRIDPKRFNASIAQELRYDNNVTLTSDENTSAPTQKPSFILETNGSAQYQTVFKKRYLIIPNIRFNFVEYADREDPEVYQNNSLTYYLGLKNKLEHSYRERPASFIFDVDYSNTSKDYNQVKKRKFYASSITYTLGENFHHFPIGDTTIKIKKKHYEGENTSINSHTYTFNISQNFFLDISHLVILLFELNLIDNYNNDTASSNTYLLRLDYLIPEIFPRYLLSTSLSTTFTDTKLQSETNGLEKTITASIELSKEVAKNTKIGIKYSPTKSISKDVTNRYTKHEIGTEVTFSF